MKNPFRFFRRTKDVPLPADLPDATDEAPDPPEQAPAEVPEPQKPADRFVEWRRTQVRGGIERRERNDIFEEYVVFGADNGQLICRLYHRYPEHEREFGLTVSRQLSFDEFNRRLLSELDRGDLKLADYNACIKMAEELSGVRSDASEYEGFSDSEAAALIAFCEAADTLVDKEYRRSEGVLYCSCRGAVGYDRLNLRFRRPFPHDALFTEVAGVSRKTVEGFEIESLWIMGIYNRLRDRCGKCTVTLLTSEWSLAHESLYLMTVQGFANIEGTLMLVIGDEASFPRFGFCSLDFSKK